MGSVDVDVTNEAKLDDPLEIPEEEDLPRPCYSAYRVDTSPLGPEFDHLIPWGPIRPTCAAAKWWNRNVDSLVGFLNAEKFPWNAVHLGVLKKHPAVAIGYEASEEKVDDSIIERLRAGILPEAMFPVIKLFETKVQKGSSLEVEDYSQIASCGTGITRTPDREWGHSAEIERRGQIIPASWMRSAWNIPRTYQVIAISYHGGTAPCGAHLHTVKVIKDERAFYEERLAELKEKYEMLGTPIPQRPGGFEAQILEISKQLELANSFDRDFGTVVGTSGYRVHPGTRHSLDWGVFRLLNERIGKNRVSGSFGCKTQLRLGLIPALGW
ncbi:hypothetical protein ABW21_db0207621 [Orbilia brochopaga]|nr:hypothetical protein ABW21_db0207621 [Drechslerella brochopaga]